MEITVVEKNVNTKIEEPFLVEAIQEYISKSNFPTKLEVKRIKATKAYYDEKTKQHDKLIQKAQAEIEILGAKSDSLRAKCTNLLMNLRNQIS